MLRVGFLPLAAWCLACVVQAFEPDADGLVAAATDRAIQRGMRWLADRQHEDGGFGAGAFRGNAGISALAGMAMLAQGSTPGRGPYGRSLDRTIDYLLVQCRPSGLIAGPDDSQGPMYGHGFATMFLAECYGMAPRPELRDKLAAAVKLIVASQNQQGGWRYQPVRAEADVSVTVCQMMALRAARHAGLSAPGETIDRAVGYVRRCQNPDGGFMYMQPDGPSAFPRSAAAVAALFSAGVHRGPEIDRGLRYLMQYLRADADSRPESYYFYGQYYAALAFWQSGDPHWRRWYAAMRDQLIARQRDDGSWLDPVGNQSGTAMALIALQLPNNCLPIFQR